MPTYVAMLRGINVSGHSQIKMPVLHALFEALGYAEVRTYIQSGNVVFTTLDGTSPGALAQAISAAILAELGLSVPVILRTGDQLADVAAHNPFSAGEAKVSVTFLASAPDLPVGNVPDSSPDQFVVRGDSIYLYCPNGYGRTKLNNGFWERRLKLAATTRNWNTVTKLCQLARPNRDDLRR